MGSRKPLHRLDCFLAGRATRAEDFYSLLVSHRSFSSFFSRFVSSKFNQSCSAVSQREQVTSALAPVPRGQAFHNEATINSPTAPYSERLDSHCNLPSITPTPAILPTTNDP